MTKFEVGKKYIRKDRMGIGALSCLYVGNGIVLFKSAETGTNAFPGRPLAFEERDIHDLYEIVDEAPKELVAQVAWVKFPSGLFEPLIHHNPKFYSLGDTFTQGGAVGKIVATCEVRKMLKGR